MASAIAGVRFVRCPKCEKVLAEFGQVPVYRCGGCGTVLRAKARASTAETTVRGSALEKDSQTPTESSSSSISSFVNKSASSANQTDTSLEVGNGMQRVAQSDHHRVLNANAACDSNGKEESIEKDKNRTKERRYEDSSSAVIAESLPEKGNQVREEETESSLQDLHDSSLNEKKEESSYRVDSDIKLTSLSLDASDSSRDEQPLSRRRRFRHKKGSSHEDGSTEKGTTPQPQTQGIAAELPDESEMGYATRRRRSLGRDTTFGSADFHSVQNWMGSEIGDEDLIALSKELLSPGNSEPDHMKILRKVDELRDELSEFLTKTSEGRNQDPHFKPRERERERERPKLPPRVPKVPTQNGETEKSRKKKKKKKKQQQYFRPVCGGAPFVICYKCWTLLQLPADFLVSGKTLHKLRCGACSEILVFSFRSRGRADPPLTPTEAQHPPSEVDARADPISPSSERCSSEPNEVSRSSSYSTRSLRQGRLHRLLGYSSASDVLFRHEGGYDDGGSICSETSTPQFYRPPRDDRRRRYGHYGGTGITSTSKSPEIQEVEESSAPPFRRRGSAIGLLKKGMREFSHGLENVKLKVHSRG